MAPKTASQKNLYRPYGLDDPSRRRHENPTVRDRVEFEKYSWETAGGETELVIEVQPGGGVPKHRHLTYSERMTPVSGRLWLETGATGDVRHQSLGPGESYLIRPGEWHRFYLPDDAEPCAFRVRCEPAHQGFEILVSVAYGMAKDGLADRGPPPAAAVSFDHLWLLAISDSVAYGWAAWATSLVAGVALTVAEWTGRKDAMIRKYYGERVEDPKSV